MLASITRILSLTAFIIATYLGYVFMTSEERVEPYIVPAFNPVSTGKLSPIIRMGTSEYSFICSGVVISKDFALTAAHCVDDILNRVDPQPLFISDVDGNFITNNVSAVSMEGLRDIALLRGDFSEFSSYEVDWEGKYFNDFQKLGIAAACGFPSGEKLFCPLIKYSGNYFFRMAFTGGPIYKGQSGGPVLITVEGKLVVIGVNSGVSFNSIIIGPTIGAKSILWGY